MKYFLTLWAIVFSVLCLFAAYPTPPAGYAYETDLRPHALVLTNATAAGLATRVDVTTNKPHAIYTPDGQTWTDATGCVWRVAHEDYWVVTYFDRRRPNAQLYKKSDNVWECPAVSNQPPYEIWYTGTSWVISTDVESYSTYGDETNTYLRAGMDVDTYGEAYRVMGAVTNLVTRLACTNELAAAALKPTAIYTPDGDTYTDATGCVWRIDSADCWRVEIEDGVRTNIVLRGAGNYWSLVESEDGPIRYVAYNGEIWQYSCYQSSLEGYSINFDDITGVDVRLLTADGYRLVRFDEVTTNLVTRVAYTNELANLTTTIPQTVTNVVRDVQGLVYDEKLGITWKQIMYDGNLYYVAVTNANITEVAQ